MDRRSEISEHVSKARAEVKAEEATDAKKLENEPQWPAADLSIMRQGIGAKFSLPRIVADRLTGSTVEEITADAQKIAEHFRPGLRTKPMALVKGAGAAEHDPGTDIDPVRLAAAILKRRALR
ncbi:hypothetical protein ACIQBJ_11000 [Kitasatospora sp. NPDC088391]|uniref:hypothetical protein n=1 Tax=Kitasatospora sp. NPDC088391 TaxID=3364074 RepID=UPI0038067CAC